MKIWMNDIKLIIMYIRDNDVVTWDKDFICNSNLIRCTDQQSLVP